MRSEIFSRIAERLAGDASLATLLGAGGVVRRAGVDDSLAVPSVTLTPGVESARPKPGSALTGNRGASPTLQVDVWVDGRADGAPCTGDDADAISDLVDDLLLDAASPISGTSGWVRISDSHQRDSAGLWHNSARYAFRYSLTN